MVASVAMFKIGEFSRLGQVTVRTLRHYDQLGLLQPGHVDPESGYRYYTLDQLPRLNRILALKDLGLSLEQVGHVLDRALSAEDLRAMLREREADLARGIAEQEETLARVRARLRMVEHEGQDSSYLVARKAVPATVLASIRAVVPSVPDMEEYRCRRYEDLYVWLGQRHITPSGYEVALYHDAEYVDRNIDTEVGVFVPVAAMDTGDERVSVRHLPAVAHAAYVVHRGDVWDIPQALVALYAWVSANGLTATGPVRELHLSGREGEIGAERMVVLEFQLPVTPAQESRSSGGSEHE